MNACSQPRHCSQLILELFLLFGLALNGAPAGAGGQGQEGFESVADGGGPFVEAGCDMSAGLGSFSANWPTSEPRGYPPVWLFRSSAVTMFCHASIPLALLSVCRWFATIVSAW